MNNNRINYSRPIKEIPNAPKIFFVLIILLIKHIDIIVLILTSGYKLNTILTTTVVLSVSSMRLSE